jgi:hypothetical protein
VKLTPEWIALAVNLCSLVYFVVKRAEPGKMLYWLGATILTAGLIKMRG